MCRWVPPDNIVRWRSAGVSALNKTIDKVPFAPAHLALPRSNLAKVAAAWTPLLIGTDVALPGILPGISTQMELALYAEAGLSPKNILRAATANAAKFAGMAWEFGTIETGKSADLILLDADPTVDIANTRMIRQVIRAGVLVAGPESKE